MSAHPYPRYSKGKHTQYAATPTDHVRLRQDGWRLVVDEPTAAPDVPAPPVEPAPPSENAPKALWVKWAVDVHGLSETDAEALTKAELISLAAGEA